MNSVNMNLPFENPGPLLRDEEGRLYDPGVREAILRMGPPSGRCAVIEATAAVRLAAKRLHLWMERWTEAHGLSEGRFQVLMRLYHVPGHRLPLGELAGNLAVTPRTITGLIDHLERDGLVARKPDAADRRSVLAQLTPAGRDRIEAIRRDAISRQDAARQGLSDDQLCELRHLCLSLVESLVLQRWLRL